MSITQQYLLDSYRAAQHGEPAAARPRPDDWQVVREVRDYGRFRAVVGGTPRPWPVPRRRWPGVVPRLRPAASGSVSRAHEFRDRRLHVVGRPLQARGASR